MHKGAANAAPYSVNYMEVKMKLVNKSQKVVFVNAEMIMPDGYINVGEDVVQTPGVSALVETGVLAVDDADKKKVEADETERALREKIEKEITARLEEQLRQKYEEEKAKLSAEAAQETQNDAEVEAETATKKTRGRKKTAATDAELSENA